MAVKRKTEQFPREVEGLRCWGIWVYRSKAAAERLGSGFWLARTGGELWNFYSRGLAEATLDAVLLNLRRTQGSDMIGAEVREF